MFFYEITYLIIAGSKPKMSIKPQIKDELKARQNISKKLDNFDDD